jgi:hypothetical protein
MSFAPKGAWGDDNASEAGSARSITSSRRGPRYKKVGAGGADEALFGGGRSSRSSNRSGPPSESGGGGGGRWATPSKSDLIKGGKIPARKGFDTRNAAIISSNDLYRIKQSTIIKTDAMVAADKAAMDAQYDAKMQKAKARKQYLRQKGEEAKKRAETSAADVQAERMRIAKKEAATAQRDMDNDAVKALTTLGERAAAFTVRHQQIAEKASREKFEEEYNSRHEKLMELDRLRELEERERVEVIKRKVRLEDAEVLRSQIHGRRQQKLREDKAVEMEGEVMKAQIQKNIEAEQARQAQKVINAKEKRQEILEENAIAIARKAEDKRVEEQADEQVVQYMKEKAAMQAQQEQDEKDRIHAANMLHHKLLTQQEKIMNNQSDIDELRAKRHREEQERKENRAETLKEENRQSNLKMMQEARVQQLEMKRIEMALECHRNQTEYNLILGESERITRREELQLREAAKGRVHHKNEILKQISHKEQTRSQAGKIKQKEGNDLKQEFATELAKLEKAREQIVEEFTNQGCHTAYLSEMKKADMRKFQLR